MSQQSKSKPCAEAESNHFEYHEDAEHVAAAEDTDFPRCNTRHLVDYRYGKTLRGKPEIFSCWGAYPT
jgi:hypothetical protein